MSREELAQAMATGRERVQAAAKDGINLLSFGEMGIGKHDDVCRGPYSIVAEKDVLADWLRFGPGQL